MNAVISGLQWQSDWIGDEVGFASIEVVGLYTSDNLNCSFYLNTENGEVLEVIPHGDAVKRRAQAGK